MIVVSNTTPLNYLVLMGYGDLLPRLFGQLWVPEAVILELRAEATPQGVRQWAAAPPEWLRIETVTPKEEDVLERLQAGEREALLLFRTLGADLLLMDEKLGRLEAARRRIAVTGTLGVLRTASREGIVNLEEAVHRLMQTSFHASRSLLETFLEKERRWRLEE